MSKLKGIYNRSCKVCPLHKTDGITCLSGRGNVSEAGIVVVGDAPGREEAPRGAAFVDERGRLVTEQMKKAGFPIGPAGEVFATYAVKCYPAGKLKVKDVKACAQEYLLEELDRFKPRLILVLGKQAQLAVTGNNTAIAKTHGRLQTYEGDGWSCSVIALDHPFSILSSPAKLDQWIADLERAKAVYYSEGSPYWDDSKLVRFDFRVVESINHFKSIARSLIEEHRGDYLAIDIEASGLDDTMWLPDYKVYTLQFGIVDLEDQKKNDSNPVYVLPIQSSQWSACSHPMWLDKVRGLLNNFLHPRYFKTVAHNGKYDLKGLRRIGVDKAYLDRDTMGLWANTHGEAPLSLKEIAFQVSDFGGYEKPMEEYFKEHETYDAPPELLTKYGALDIVVTRRLFYEVYHGVMQEMT